MVVLARLSGKIRTLTAHIAVQQVGSQTLTPAGKALKEARLEQLSR